MIGAGDVVLMKSRQPQYATWGKTVWVTVQQEVGHGARKMLKVHRTKQGRRFLIGPDEVVVERCSRLTFEAEEHIITQIRAQREVCAFKKNHGQAWDALLGDSVVVAASVESWELLDFFSNRDALVHAGFKVIDDPTVLTNSGIGFTTLAPAAAHDVGPASEHGIIVGILPCKVTEMFASIEEITQWSTSRSVPMRNKRRHLGNGFSVGVKRVCSDGTQVDYEGDVADGCIRYAQDLVHRVQSHLAAMEYCHNVSLLPGSAKSNGRCFQNHHPCEHVREQRFDKVHVTLHWQNVMHTDNVDSDRTIIFFDVKAPQYCYAGYFLLKVPATGELIAIRIHKGMFLVLDAAQVEHMTTLLPQWQSSLKCEDKNVFLHHVGNNAMRGHSEIGQGVIGYCFSIGHRGLSI